jgi:ribosomal protein S12 methylthiotransferase
MKVGFVSLGCSKNLVDTEMMIGLFKNEGYEIVNDPSLADIIIVNTCGFIGPAKEEGVNTILEMAEYKKKNCKYLLVTGCLVERYKKELMKEIPEVDAFIKFSEYETFWPQVESIIGKNENKNKERDALDFLDRVITTGDNYAYIRIAEGCNNFCTFCAIPYIRGRFVSRKEEDILKEVESLAKQGIREFIIIAQDTTKYGVDIYGKPMLADLIKKISKIKGVEWIRFLYSYPETITDDLIEEVKTNKKVCKYFDIPMQHVSDNVLKRMNRKTTSKSTREIISKLRKEIPGVIIRSTLMVGFPGETQEDFDELYEFVEWAKFDKLGCFTYSKEEGTAAAKLDNQVHPSTKNSRYNKIMALQQEISNENLKRFIGKKFKVLIENAIVEDDQLYFVGRSYMDVPDVDGYFYIKATKEQSEQHEINTFVDCKVTDITDNYDLVGVFDD